MRGVALLLTGFLICCGSTFAATQVLRGTGFDASGKPLASGGTDAAWTVFNDPFPGHSAFFIAPGNPDWFTGVPPYAPNTNVATYRGSGWISDNASSNSNGPAPYTFFMTFDLSRFVLSSVTISGLWSIADGGVLAINGHVVAALPAPGVPNPWSSLHAFSFNDTALLNQGLNIITITVTSSDDVDDAARFEGTVTGSLISDLSR